MVLSPQALFYADPDLDITDEVTALLDVALAKNLTNRLMFISLVSLQQN